MSDARKMAKLAEFEIEELISDMLEGDYQDNEIALGHLSTGKSSIQVQLKITRNPVDFLDADYVIQQEDGE